MDEDGKGLGVDGEVCDAELITHRLRCTNPCAISHSEIKIDEYYLVEQSLAK